MNYATLAKFKYDWQQWARPSQLPPAEFTSGRKRTWLILSGRGWGKTRCGSEMVRTWVKHFSRVNVIGATIADTRDICVTGESGILAVCPKSERPRFVPSRHVLEWPNGATSLLFSADEPERLRGKQHEKLWMDELAAWRSPESFDQAMFGLRLGVNPQSIITTTPRPSLIIRELAKDQNVIVTRGGSYENAANLAAAFLGKITAKYKGTRIGRQELDGEILEDREGALFTQALIDAARVDAAPELVRVVVAVDPSVSSGPDSDECGIIAAGMDGRKPAHFYILDDESLQATPERWARKAVSLYHRHGADRIVAETNQGGELVEATIRTFAPDVSYKAVHASRGKVIRAEPISALYEQHRVHHVGIFGSLEDQMTDWLPGVSTSPDRLDSLVWGLTELSEHGTGQHFADWLASWWAKKTEQESQDDLTRRGGMISTQTQLPGSAPGVVTINTPASTDHFGNVRDQPTESKTAFRFEDPRGLLSRPSLRR